MTVFERTLALLDRHADLAPAAILRASIDRRQRLTLETDGGGRSRWFRSDGRSLEELLPQDDPKLPLARKLGEDPESWDLLAWRPGRRLALRRRDPSPMLVKGYRPARLAAVTATLERAQALPTGDVVAVPRLLRVNPELGAYEASWLPGVRPVVRASRAAEWALVGRALRHFQRGVDVAGLDQHGVAQELEVLEVAALRFQEVAGALPTAWAEVRARLDPATAPDGEPVAVHRDLHDGQLLVEGEQVGLLDLDGLCAGSPVLDAANLSAHLALRARQRLDRANGHGAEVCGRAMLTACFGECGADLHAPLRFYQASTFLRLALLYQMRPRWAHLVPDLIRFAERCLDELATV